MAYKLYKVDLLWRILQVVSEWEEQPLLESDWKKQNISMRLFRLLEMLFLVLLEPLISLYLIDPQS